MNKYIYILIAVVAVGATTLLIWRSMTAVPQDQQNVSTQGSQNQTPTGTVTQTPQVTPSATPRGSVSPTVTTTPTVTVTPTPTTVATSDFETNLNTNWVSGQTTQTVSGKVYFVDNSNKKVLKRGAAANDVSAETVFTSDAGNIGTFNVIGSSIIIAIMRDASTNESKLVRFYPSTNKTSLLYKYSSSKVEIANFLIPKDSTSEFYLGLTGVDNKFQPMALYSKQYSQVWIQTLEGSKKEDGIVTMGITKDAKTLKVKLKSASENVVLLTIPQ
jgi:hypothetical protein